MIDTSIVEVRQALERPSGGGEVKVCVALSYIYSSSFRQKINLSRYSPKFFYTIWIISILP